MDELILTLKSIASAVSKTIETTILSTTSSNSSRRTFFEQLSKSSFIAFGGNLLLMNDI